MKYEQNALENRQGSDRRKRNVAALKYLFFGGRRKRIRREEDEKKLILLDVHGSKTFAVALIIFILSAVDGLFTLNLIGLGARETNPLMSYLIDLNLHTYLAIKCILTILGIILLIILKNYKSKLLGLRISKLLPTIVLAFLIITAYELYMILN